MDTDVDKAAELAAQAELKEEEVRSKVIEDFGFDSEADKERIDKLVNKEIENSKKLSSAIGQKIKYRSEWEKLQSDPRLKVAATPPAEPKAPAEDPRKLIAEELEKRDLDSMEYPPELKKEIQRIAQITGVSVRVAERDPYIVNKIADHEKSQKAQEAAISRTNRSSGKKSYSLDNPPDVDMSTKDGRDEWEAYINWAKKQ